MTRVKSVFAVLLLAATVSVAPHQAQTVKVVLAGSSAMWQSMALAAYKAERVSPAEPLPVSTTLRRTLTSQTDGRPPRADDCGRSRKRLDRLG